MHCHRVRRTPASRDVRYGRVALQRRGGWGDTRRISLRKEMLRRRRAHSTPRLRPSALAPTRPSGRPTRLGRLAARPARLDPRQSVRNPAGELRPRAEKTAVHQARQLATARPSALPVADPAGAFCHRHNYPLYYPLCAASYQLPACNSLAITDSQLLPLRGKHTSGNSAARRSELRRPGKLPFRPARDLEFPQLSGPTSGQGNRLLIYSIQRCGV
jgi:hypothetical protein